MEERDAARKADDSVSPTLRELAGVLFRQGTLFVGVSVLVFVSAIVYAFAGASYRAHARVLVRRGA